MIETWRRHYNEVRPHSSLGHLTPTEFKAKHLSAIRQIGEATLQESPGRRTQADQFPPLAGEELLVEDLLQTMDLDTDC